MIAGYAELSTRFTRAPKISILCATLAMISPVTNHVIARRMIALKSIGPIAKKIPRSNTMKWFLDLDERALNQMAGLFVAVANDWREMEHVDGCVGLDDLRDQIVDILKSLQKGISP